MAGDAERTAAEALGVTGGISARRAHSGVAWWSRESRDESSTLAAKAVALAVGRRVCDARGAAARAALPALCTLLPRIHPAEGGASTYTFVTGDGRRRGSYVRLCAALNAHAVYGLAAAARAELINSPLKVAELASTSASTVRRRARRRPARTPALPRHWRDRRRGRRRP